MAERAFTMIREMVAAAREEGSVVDIGEVVTTVLLAFPDLDLTREDLTLAVANEASSKGVPVFFSGRREDGAGAPE